jgi:hypothetical protein
MSLGRFGAFFIKIQQIAFVDIFGFKHYLRDAG